MATSDAPLNVPNVTLAVARGAASGGTSPEPTLFYDGFESADMSAPTGPAPAKNTSGFTWSKMNKTQVVTMDNGTPKVVFNTNGVKNNTGPTGADWTAINGDYSLRFRYDANEEWTEQRFNLGGSYPEIWFRYWIRVPFNFAHGTQAKNNNKFFAVYMDAYSTAGTGATVTLEMWGTSGGSNSITVNRSGGSGNVGHSDNAPWIQVPQDQGRWMEVVIQLVASSSNTTWDGEVRLWRRWENETGFTKLQELTGELFQVPTTGPASNGWHQGYVMGYANATYSETTEWLVDDFRVSETSLLGE